MSALGDALTDYLSLRRSFGYKLAEAARLLPRFVAYMDATGAEFVTVEAALAWSLEPDAKPPTEVWTKRMIVVRGFARFLTGIDPRTEVPPPGLIPNPRRWQPPFIYSEADILALMAAARRLIPHPLRAATHETLIGLLSATGLRIGEALRLDRSDIDWTERTLLVRESKFNKSRIVPLQQSTSQALRRYANTRDQLCPTPREQSFFVSLRGTRLIYQPIMTTFRKLCDSSGVGAGATPKPRIHHIRHTFAINVLTAAYREGLDVQSHLSQLSTYMGHRTPQYTFIYLSAAPELLAHAARMLHSTNEVTR